MYSEAKGRFLTRLGYYSAGGPGFRTLRTLLDSCAMPGSQLRVDSVSLIGTGIDIALTRDDLTREAFDLASRYDGTWEVVSEEAVKVNESMAQVNVVLGRQGGNYRPQAG